MKISKKYKKFLPLGILIVLIAGVTTWALHRLIYDGLATMLTGFSSFEQNVMVVVAGVILLAVLGQNFFKKYGK